MPIPFGVGVGDFIAVGSLIVKVVQELKENSEASSEHQQLLLDLETLSRSLSSLEKLQPGPNEFVRLQSIRAAAQSCRFPLERFLKKIEKFEYRLGTWNARKKGFATFTRRMQWRLMYKDDVKDLQASLGGQIATITMLLMAQAVESITLHQGSTVKQSSGILQAIEEHKRSLESCSQSLKGLHLKTDTVNTHSSTLQSDLVKQERVIEETNSRTMRIREQTSRIEEAAQETSSSLAVINQQNDSILHGTTQILSMVTSGLITINSIGEQIYRLFQMFTTFNAEMRAYAQYMFRWFDRIHAVLQRIEANLPARLMEPSVVFQDAWGKTMAVPLQICQNFKFLHTFIGILFDGKPGQWRIDARQYALLRTQTRRRITSPEAINAGDQVSMGIVLPELACDGRVCPFPSCGAALLDTEDQRNEGQTCPECLRWFEAVEVDHPVKTRGGAPRELSVQSGGQQLSGDSTVEGRRGNDRSEDEIELYRQIYAQSWREAVWDSISAYQLHPDILRAYLEGRFGDHDFQIHLEMDKFKVWIPRCLEKEELEELLRRRRKFEDGTESDKAGIGEIPTPSEQIHQDANPNPVFLEQLTAQIQETTVASSSRDTMEVQPGSTPDAIRRVASHLDPNQPIRLRPEYHPPAPDGAPDGNPGSVGRIGSMEDTAERIRRERDARIAELEANRRREELTRQQDDEIRRRRRRPVIVPPRPLGQRDYLRPVVDQSQILQERIGGLTIRDERLVIIEEAESRLRLEARERAILARRQDQEEEEALKQRLRERQMPRRIFSVGPGGRRHRVLYDDEVYKWE